MGDPCLRVCIVGAGASGLPAIKACRDENLDVVCYEKTGDIGGLWNYRPDQQGIGGTVMRTTVVNTSKEMMAYSDFPPDHSLPNFMEHTRLMSYLRSYALHFNLLKHIHFNSSVQKIRRSCEGKKAWEVRLEDGRVEHFDRVMLCTGHHALPLQPDVPGMSSFPGRILHAHDYRDWKGFEDKRVFLLGIGNSALDIAVDLAKIAKEVYIATRRGSWIFNRVSTAGMPYDIILMTRVYEWLKQLVPWTVLNDFMEHRLTQRLDHDIYGLRPAHRFFQQHPTVNDSLANLLCSGQIKIVNDVERVAGSEIFIKEGGSMEADVFIFCTGYSFSFPYLQPGVFDYEDHRVDLYNFVFPPASDDIAVIGLVQPIGSIAPISELQSRWAAGVFAGRYSLPSKSERHRDIEEKRKAMQRRYYKSSRHSIQVDYMSYMDELSHVVGCYPQPFQTLLSDWRLGLRLVIGPNAPYAYRLNGPHSWEGARDAVMNLAERVKLPLKHRSCRIRRHKRRGRIEEWLRYGSLKWLAGWTCLMLCSGLWLFCASPLSSLSPFSFFLLVLIYLALFSILLLWFDIQFDMTTIL